MKRIGITGGIGSGKSAVSAWLRDKGFPVYDSDAEARRLMCVSDEIVGPLTERFGTDIYSNGVLNRKKLADKIFSDNEAREFVNSIVHPVVVSDFMSWSYSQECDFVFVESAILYDCQLKEIVDEVVYVDALERIRIDRTMRRDSAPRDAVEARIHAQTDHRDEARWIVDNDGTLDELHSRLEKIAVNAGWASREDLADNNKQKKTKAKKEKKRGVWAKIGWTVLTLWLLSILWVVLLKFIPVIYTPLMFRRMAEAAIEGRDVNFERNWVSLDNVSSKYISACLASEDNLFATHHGFSERAIKAAWEHNKKGGKLRGGSTISQQTAKNVFTFGTRTWIRKGFETYYTILIELIWGKERIMEVYCNIAELGDGVYGVEAASQKYFHRSAKKLNASQAALMVAALPSPRRYSITHPGPYMRKRQSQIQWLMPKMRKFPPKE